MNCPKPVEEKMDLGQQERKNIKKNKNENYSKNEIYI